MSDEQSLAEQYASAAINHTARWKPGTKPLLWRPGDSPSRIGRALILRDNAHYGWYRQPPTRYYADLPELAGWASGAVGYGLDLHWRRLPTERERATLPYVHIYDRNGSFLSTAGSVGLPTGDPSWFPDAAYTKEPGKGAPQGVWQVDVSYDGSPWDGYELPAVCPDGEGIWLWTKTLQTAIDCGYRVTPALMRPGAVLWICEECNRTGTPYCRGHKVLGTWARHLWDARRALETDTIDYDGPAYFQDEPARVAAISLIKDIYSRTISGFATTPREGEATAEEKAAGLDDDLESLPRWRRPEWYAGVHADAAGWLFYYMRKTTAAGMPPLWCYADALALTSNDGPTITAGAAGLNLTPHQCGAMHWAAEVSIGHPDLYDPRSRDLAVPGRGARLRLPGVRVRA